MTYDHPSKSTVRTIQNLSSFATLFLDTCQNPVSIERRRETDLELAKSLCYELFNGWQLSFIDDLLCDEVEEVTEACDDHLHVLWTDSPNHNWEEA